jgi:serine/threonine protein phosphatase 1
MTRTYAIGDIHGQLALLHHAHTLIEADRRATGDYDAPVIHLGDLVDRGPDSAGVIRFLREGVTGGAPWQVLLGNHDRLFLRFVTDPDWRDAKLSHGLTYLHPLIGGQETLMSYGLYRMTSHHLRDAQRQAADAVPPEDLAFLASLPLMQERGPALFVHAGIRPGVPLDAQAEEDLVWIREPFLSDDRDHGLLVVHGHTAIPRPLHYRNRLNLDSRAGYGGPLTCVVLEGRDVSLLTPDGRAHLTPA